MEEEKIVIDGMTWTEKEMKKNYAKIVLEESRDSEDDEGEVKGQTEQCEKFKKEPFDPEEWELVDEDECVVDLVGMLDKEYLDKCDKDRVKLIDLFSGNGKTLLQLDQMIFVGEPSEGFGTNVIFEEVPTEVTSSDEDFDNQAGKSGKQEASVKRNIHLKYVTGTRKKLTLTRTILTKKE